MRSFVRVCAIGSALLAAGCSSGGSTWDFLPSSISGGANVSLTIESDPPGADAKTSLGPSCRTPCMIPVPADRNFTVNYSLNGYLPQAIQVGPRVVAVGTVDVAGRNTEDFGTTAQPELTPNPVYAQLQPAPPASPSRKGRAKQAAKKPPQ